MKLGVADNIDKLTADALIAVYQERALEARVAASLPRPMALRALEAIRIGDFTAKLETTTSIYTGNTRVPRLVLAGAGNEDSWEDLVERTRLAVSTAITLLKQNTRVKRVGLYIDDTITSNGERDFVIEQAIVAAYMANYVFHRRTRREKPHQLRELILVSHNHEDKVLERARGIAEGIYLARDVANAPSNEMSPEGVEHKARELSRRYGLNLRVFYKNELESMGMGGILAVGSGSNIEPRLIVLEHKGGGKTIAVVGKTVTFDAGGLNLKTHEAMYEMKFDKSGGAVALGLAASVAALKLPVNLVVLVPAVENLPSGTAYKPRDVIRMHNGMTVEIGNTDAEGRLILADALAYAVEKYKPDYTIDLATLTGAIVVALGNHAAGLFSNNDELASKLEEAAWRVWEPVWRMPLWKPYHKQLESMVADLNNIGGRPAGAITAAAFLSQFVDDKPWAHLDIAGVAFTQDKGPIRPYYPRGATGWGLRTLVEFIRRITS